MIRVVPGEKGRYFRYHPARMKGDFAETIHGYDQWMKLGCQ